VDFESTASTIPPRSHSIIGFYQFVYQFLNFFNNIKLLVIKSVLVSQSLKMFYQFATFLNLPLHLAIDFVVIRIF